MDHDGAHATAAELRTAAATLREMVPHFRGGQVTEFVPVAAARLLDAVADSIGRGDPVRDGITSSALEIARHLRTYRPGDPQ